MRIIVVAAVAFLGGSLFGWICCAVLSANITAEEWEIMMSLADWWYSSFGEEETDEAKAIRKVLDKVEQSIGAMTVVETEEEGTEWTR